MDRLSTQGRLESGIPMCELHRRWQGRKISSLWLLVRAGPTTTLRRRCPQSRERGRLQGYPVTAADHGAAGAVSILNNQNHPQARNQAHFGATLGKAMQSRNLPRLRRLAPLALLCGLGACSSIVEGTSQVIRVNTNPSEATCTMSRDGRVLGVIQRTPGAIKVEKNSNGIRVDCQKPGYETTTQWLDSEFAAAVLGNLILGGVIGVVVDSASGASRKYADEVNLALARPGEARPPAPAATVPQSAPRTPIPAHAGVATSANAAPRPTQIPSSPAPIAAPSPSAPALTAASLPPPATLPVAFGPGARTGDRPGSPFAVPMGPLPPGVSSTPRLAAAPSSPAATPMAVAVPAVAPAPLRASEPAVSASPASAAGGAEVEPIAEVQPPPLSDFTMRRLASLKAMLDRRALTPAEYERKRLAVLAQG